jgi:hypothetical protein
MRRWRVACLQQEGGRATPHAASVVIVSVVFTCEWDLSFNANTAMMMTNEEKRNKLGNK